MYLNRLEFMLKLDNDNGHFVKKQFTKWVKKKLEVHARRHLPPFFLFVVVLVVLYIIRKI